MAKQYRQRELWEDLSGAEREEWTGGTDTGSVLTYILVFSGSIGLIALMLIHGVGIVGEFIHSIVLGGK
jgi:hypothetical protein